uniref:BESS domain-containing protein n=1 Tax=Lygus hesperus TaxID=30085 RepID=A0A146KWF8_LYGHE
MLMEPLLKCSLRTGQSVATQVALPPIIPASVCVNENMAEPDPSIKLAAKRARNAKYQRVYRAKKVATADEETSMVERKKMADYRRAKRAAADEETTMARRKKDAERKRALRAKRRAERLSQATSTCKLSAHEVPASSEVDPFEEVAATRKPRKKRIIESEFIENDPLALDDEPMIDIPSGSGSGGCIVVKQEPTGEEFTDPLSIGQLETLARTENYGEIPKFIPLKSETDATQGDVVPLDLEEDDLLYFKSLAPDLAYLTPDLKEVFRIKVRNILKELSIQ